MHGLQQDFQPLLKWNSLNLSAPWYRSALQVRRSQRRTTGRRPSLWSAAFAFLPISPGLHSISRPAMSRAHAKRTLVRAGKAVTLPSRPTVKACHGRAMPASRLAQSSLPRPLLMLCIRFASTCGPLPGVNNKAIVYRQATLDGLTQRNLLPVHITRRNPTPKHPA